MQEARCYTQLLTPAGTAVYMYCCPAMLWCMLPHTHTRTHRHPGRSPRDMCPVLSGPACHTVSVMCVTVTLTTHTHFSLSWVQTVLHAAPCGCRRGRKGGDLGLWWESWRALPCFGHHWHTGTQVHSTAITVCSHCPTHPRTKSPSYQQ